MSATVETKSRGILFSAPMVLALLDVRKTQTRRIVKPQPDESFAEDYRPDGSVIGRRSYGWTWDKRRDGNLVELRNMPEFCPYGGLGDELWVRETTILGEEDFTYAADGAEITVPDDIEWGHSVGTVSSIHMPKWASRIFLRITDVRVQRVQDISVKDCIAEGIICESPDLGGFDEGLAFFNFIDVWNKVSGPDSWNQNPWVFAITFERIK